MEVGNEKERFSSRLESNENRRQEGERGVELDQERKYGERGIELD
jgi:hypothetical protein